MTRIVAPLAIHRNLLITILKDAVNAERLCSVHTASRLTSYAETADGLALTFSNGASARADVLVGADGVRSAVRQGMFSQHKTDGGVKPEPSVNAKWSGTIAYRALVTAEQLQRVHGGPHSAATVFNIVSLPHRVVSTDRTFVVLRGW